MKSGQALRVLLIEDNPSDVLLLRAALEADALSNFALTTVERLADGLQKLDEAMFDIVLADLGLPDNSGLSTFEQLHSHAPNLPMVVFSGNEDEEQAIQAVRGGAQDYLVKSLSGFDMAARTIRHAIERNKLQTTLREGEERLELVMEGSQLGYWDWNIEAGKVYRNERWAEMLGYTLEEIELSVKQWTDLHHPDDREAAWRSIQDHLDGKTPAHRMEYRMRTKDGQYKWILDQAKVVKRDAQGKPLRMSGTHTDITERKRAEEKLRESEEQYRLLFNSIPNAIVYTDLNYKIQNWNPAAEKMYGWTDAQSVLARPMQDIVHPDYINRSLEEVEKGLLDNGQWQGEVIHHRQDGTPFPVLASGTLVKDHLANGIGYVAINADITERKQAEAARRESEQRFTALFRLNPVPVGITRASNYRIVDVNDAWTNLTGYTREEALGKTSIELGLAKPETLQHVSGKLEAHGYIGQSEIPLYTRSGEERHVLISAEPIKLGSEDYFLNNLLDITERKQAEESLRESEERFSTAFFTSPVSQSIITLKANEIIEVNDACCHLFGYNREELIGALTSKLNLWADPEERRSAVEELQRTGRLLPREVIIHKKTGERCTGIAAIEPISWKGMPCLISFVFDITERKQAEEKLRASEERYRNLVENMNEVLIEVDEQGNFCYLSPSYQRLSGYSAEEELHTPAFAHVHPEDIPVLLQTIQSGVLDGTKRLEYRVQAKNGDWLWVENSARMFQIEEGKTHVIGVARNVTEQRSAEEKLRESEQKYRELVNGMNDTIWVLDFETSILDVNQTAVDRLGYTRDELLSMKVSDIDTGLTREQVLTLISNVQAGKVQIFETRHNTKDGRSFPVEISSSLVSFMGKAAIMSIARDITDRKQAEQALKDSETRLKSMLDSAMDAIITTDQEMRIILFNEAAERMFGVTTEEILGHSLERFIPDRFHGFHEIQMSSLTRERAHDISFHKALSVTGLRANGEEFPAESTVSFVESKGEKLFTAILRDITERKRADEALKSSEERYQNLFEASPVSIWEEDFSAAKVRLDELKSQGVEDMRAYLKSHPDVVTELAGLVKVVNVNRAAVELVKASSKADLLKPLLDLMSGSEDLAGFLEELVNITEHRYNFFLDRVAGTLDGQPLVLSMFWSVPPSYEDTLSRVIVSAVNITDRKQAEEKLRSSEEQYRYLFENNPHPMWAYDRKTLRFLAVNDAAVEKYGYTRDEFLNMTIADIRPPEDLERLRENLAQERPALQHSGNWRHKLKNGRLIDVEISSHTIDLTDHDAALVVALDITERKQAERALQESEEKYRTLIQSTGDGVFVAQNEQFIFSNPALPIRLGYTPGEFENIPFEQVIAPDYLEVWITRFNQRIAGNNPESNYRVQFMNKTRTELIWFELRANLITYQGSPAVLGIVRDITEQKQSEEKLLVSEERLRKILQTTSDGFWIVDPSRKFVDVNEAYCAMSGYSREELLQMSIADVEALQTPLDIDERISFILSEGKARFESRHIRKDGSAFDVEVSVNALMQGNGLMVCFCRDITERKQAEKEALYRQELLEKVIQLGKKIAAITDLDKCLLEIYKSARFELGFDRIGLFLYDVTVDHILGVYGTSRTGEIEEAGFYDGPPDESGSWAKALRSPTGISWLEDYQKHFDTPEGNTMYGVHQHVTVAAWAGEKPVALITADNLITSRVIDPAEVEALQLFAGYVGLAIENASLQAELELKVEERTNEVRDLYDNAPTGYHSLDAEGRFTQVNRTELSWLGYAYEELMGRHISDILTPYSNEIFRKNFPKFKQTGSLRDLEMELVRKDGSIIPVLVSATAIFDRQGRYLSSRSTVFDNSERRKAEVALRASQANLQNFLDTASDMIQSLDESGNFVYVNDAWCEALGYSQDEAMKLTLFDVVDPQFHAHCRVVLKELVVTGHPQQLEIIFRTSTGDVIIAEGSVSGRTDKDGRSVTNGIFRNITKRKQAEESMQQANVELERALRLKDEFLASMSHELRTPLTGILGLSEALLYDTYGELSQKQKSIVGNIENNGHHLLDLINDILDISKMEAGKLELEMLSCSLAEICQSSLQLVKGMAHKKGQNIAFSINPADILVKGDVRRLKQIMVNLLSNAVKYSPEKGPIGLDVMADESSQTVRIDIWDKGMGISPDDLKRLFQPFVQLDSSLSRQQTGTGLGLALVQRLVDMHGGSIHVESAIGQGSHFIVTLPYLLGALEQKEQPSDLATHVRQTLIVEDSEIDADRLTRFLKILGVRSAVQPTAAGIIERVAALQPGVVLLDLKLPDASGWEVLEQLKLNETTRDIPVVITSVADDQERANRLGAAGYLVKPFTLEELRLTLSRIPKPEGKVKNTAFIVSPEVHLGTVMIVDDNETNILMVEDYLRSKNYNVASSLSALEFFSKAPDVRPDLVLMDIQMPDIDGLEAIRRLRLLSDPQLASVPVIAITALAMPGDRERCFEAGADEYLSKPVRLKELSSLIQHMLMDKEHTDKKP